MAAAILRHLTGRRVYVESAGVRAGGPDAFAAAVMEEIGIAPGTGRTRCAICTTPPSISSSPSRRRRTTRPWN
jgi:protein-tyrosine-phosphatase